MENHDQRECQNRRGTGDDPLDDFEFEKRGDQCQENEVGSETDENLRAPGGPEGAINLIDAGGEEKDLNAVPPVLGDEIPHEFGLPGSIHARACG